MSDRVIQSHYDGEQSYHDGDGRAESINSYQSVWMAHWTRTSCRAAPHVHNRISLCSGSNDDNDDNKRPLLSGLEIASDISKSTKGFTEVTEARAVRIINEGLTGSSKTLINERLCSQPFPMFNLCQNTSSDLDLKDDLEISCHRIVSRPQIDCNVEYNAHTTGSHFPSILAVAPPAEGTSSRECHLQSQVVSHSLKKWANSPMVVGDVSLALAGSCQDNVIGSTQMLSYKFNRGKAPVSSFMGGQEKHHQLSSFLASKEPLTNANFTMLEHEDDNYQGRFASLVCGKKRDDYSTFRNSFLRKGNASMFLHDPSTSNNNLPVPVGEQHEKTQNCSGTGLFPSRNSPPAETKPETLHVGCYSLQRMPPSMNDMETLRICTTNSVEELTGGPATVSQTSHSLLFRKKTDIGLSKENQTLQESRISTKLKGNMYSELLSLSPLDLGQRGVKTQPLGSSTDSEGKDNFEDTKTCTVRLKNESSAETDTMDMDALKEWNDISGMYFLYTISS